MVKMMVVGLVAVIALFAGPMPAAHAGGMGAGNSVAFQCNLISGPSPGGTIDLTDAFSPLARTVKVGPSRLYCTPVLGANATGDKNLAGTAPGLDAPNLKCYDIRSPKDNPGEVVTLNDFFIDGDAVTVGSAQFLCVGATEP